MCQPGLPGPHGELHEVSSPGFVAFQSAKSRGSSFSGLGSCSSTWSGPLPGERAVRRESSDPEVDVPARPRRRGRLRSAPRSGPRSRGSSRSPAAARPASRARRTRCPRDTTRRISRARRARPRRGLVDLVVDVRDVVDVGDVVAPLPQPVAQPGEDDEGHRVADVRALVDRRAADVHADLAPEGRAGRRATASRCRRGAPSSRCYSGGGAAERLVARHGGDDGPELGTALGAGQREPQELQVAADRLELADDGAGVRFVQQLSAWRRGARRTARASAPPPRRARPAAGCRICSAISRASTSVRAPRSARREVERRAATAASSASGICGDRVDREPLERERDRGERRVSAARARRGTRAPPRPGCPRREDRPPTRARRAWRASCRRHRAGARGGRPPAARRRAPGRSAAAPPRSAGDRSRG